MSPILAPQPVNLLGHGYVSAESWSESWWVLVGDTTDEMDVSCSRVGQRQETFASFWRSIPLLELKMEGATGAC